MQVNQWSTWSADQHSLQLNTIQMYSVKLEPKSGFFVIGDPKATSSSSRIAMRCQTMNMTKHSFISASGFGYVDSGGLGDLGSGGSHAGAGGRSAAEDSDVSWGCAFNPTSFGAAGGTVSYVFSLFLTAERVYSCSQDLGCKTQAAVVGELSI